MAEGKKTLSEKSKGFPEIKITQQIIDFSNNKPSVNYLF
jgi:hypothetical protein